MKRPMTRRDYRILAHALNAYLSQPPPHTVVGVVNQLTAALSAAYPNFDSDRFAAAVFHQQDQPI